MARGADIAQLRAEARYARERYDLYRAKMYGPRPTTMTRLRELERAHEGADARLRRAEQARDRATAVEQAQERRAGGPRLATPRARSASAAARPTGPASAG